MLKTVGLTTAVALLIEACLVAAAVLFGVPAHTLEPYFIAVAVLCTAAGFSIPFVIMGAKRRDKKDVHIPIQPSNDAANSERD